MTQPAPSATERLFSLSTAVAEHADELEGTDALELLADLADDLDSYTRRHVTRCRTAGVTWRAIGNALAVSPQAAQQRYGRPQ